MLLIAQTIGAASANANNRNGLGSNRSDCSEAAQPMRGRGRQRLPMSQSVKNLTLTGGPTGGSTSRFASVSPANFYYWAQNGKLLKDARQLRTESRYRVESSPAHPRPPSRFAIDRRSREASAMARIRVGLAGCGFLSELHMHAYRRVSGMDVQVKAVAARGEHVLDFARRHQIPMAYRSFRDLIADGELDVVDICTPPNLHTSMIVNAMQAGKHVICEKPFAGYFGREGDKVPIGKHVPKALMYERVLEEMEVTRTAIGKTGRLFMYAEDWIYAPAVTKTVEILKVTKDKILFMKGEESHSGSHAAHAAQWAMTGGGSLIRMGCHPLSGVLFLKQVEAKARGETISVVSVTCDVGNVAACLKPDERTYIKANPVDVEDWGTLTTTFSDGTKATIFSGDMIMGGVRNLIETYTSGGSLFANITPNNHLMSYQTNEEKLASVYFTEKVDRKTGWQYVCLEEE